MGCHCLPQPSYTVGKYMALRMLARQLFQVATTLLVGQHCLMHVPCPTISPCAYQTLFTCAEGLGTRLPTTSHLLEWTENHTTNYMYNVHILCVPTRISKQKGTALSAAAIACSSYGNINFESILVKFLLYSIHRPFGTVMITLQQYPQGCIVNISRLPKGKPLHAYQYILAHWAVLECWWSMLKLHIERSIHKPSYEYIARQTIMYTLFISWIQWGGKKGERRREGGGREEK